MSPDRKSVVEGVTGVQTCALPISSYVRNPPPPISRLQARGIARKAASRRARSSAGRLQYESRSEERRGGSDWSSDVCSSDLLVREKPSAADLAAPGPRHSAEGRFAARAQFRGEAPV